MRKTIVHIKVQLFFRGGVEFILLLFYYYFIIIVVVPYLHNHVHDDADGIGIPTG